MTAPISALPHVLTTFSEVLQTLPSALSNSTTALVPLLASFASDTSLLLPQLTKLQEQSLLSNATWISANLAQLGDYISRLPVDDVRHADHDTLVALIQSGTPYDLGMLWSPDLYAIMTAFAIAIFAKIALMMLVTRKSVNRVRNYAMEEGKVAMDSETARARLVKPAKAAISHILNLVVATVGLGLQLAAYRAFVIPGMPFRLDDLKYLTVAVRTILVCYAADFLLGLESMNPEVVFHHCMTLGLLGCGQIIVFKTHSPKFFRLCAYLLLQATAEQTTYLAMACYHSATLLARQNHRPDQQRRLLRISWYSLRISKFITYPQKLVPAIIALVWLGEMKRDVEGSADGRFWLAWATILIATLLILQVKFCDDIFTICNYVHYKLDPSAFPHPPSRTGPVMRFLFGLLPGASLRRQRAKEQHRRNDASAEKGEHELKQSSVRAPDDPSRTETFKNDGNRTITASLRSGKAVEGSPKEGFEAEEGEFLAQ
ncbi:hypothetical protein BCR35DRAFT_263328 [Leucosporidium creatinivorum]|uniref:Uncharacterized protein n=1 Tax=Leucosporidium creatinivorum TaxID=106004 RepID=A0A1Y2G110_9BASI|nr:hypothetical protein BCR35DRAFT_263328 [Leucosporidium creatinivorum]